MAKVSVIVPVYGVEKYLREAIDSVLNQTLTDLEIILIDDGGKDNCPQIIDEYAQNDSRIIAIHKQNGGYGQTCNLGLSKATGEYIAILEPDDYIDSKMYEDLYKIAKEHNSDIVKSCFYDNLQCDRLKRVKKVKWNDYIPEDKSFTIKEYPYFLYYHPSIWTCIYKKEFLDKHNIQFVEAPGAGWTDNPFQVQTMCLAQRINYTSEAYYYWRRLNYFDSDDLKDYTIPFKRTDEIHNWLEENNINDEGILLQLARREMSYIGIVLGMKKILDYEDCKKRIKEMISRIPKEQYLTEDIVRKEEKEFFKKLKNIDFTKYFLKFKRFKKSIVRFRFSRKEINFILFDKVIFTTNKEFKN